MVDAVGLSHRRAGRVTLTPFLDLVYVKNLGISYGVAAGQFAQWGLAAFAIAGRRRLGGVAGKGATSAVMAAGIGLVIGGALGNAIDRLHLGGVADFFSLHAYGFYWYVFNVADIAIVAGVIGLLYDSLIPSRKGAANEALRPIWWGSSACPKAAQDP